MVLLLCFMWKMRWVTDVLPKAKTYIFIRSTIGVCVHYIFEGEEG